MNAKTVEDETINVVNNEGFTPMLHYIHQFIQLKQQMLRTI